MQLAIVIGFWKEGILYVDTEELSVKSNPDKKAKGKE